MRALPELETAADDVTDTDEKSSNINLQSEINNCSC
jgi:hypothetical protein